MRILHISDSHGMPKKPPSDDFDVIACTGDFLPSIPGFGPCPPLMLERSYQRDWIHLNAGDIARYAAGRPFIWCAGNHDSIDPCEALAAANVDVHDAVDRCVEIMGRRWEGFPYVNHINGSMSNELKRDAMRACCESMVSDWDDVNKLPDVILAHAPPHGVYDLAHDGNRYGNVEMRRVLEERHASKRSMPKLFLCGHIHQPDGGAEWAGMRVFNSATQPRIIELE